MYIKISLLLNFFVFLCCLFYIAFCSFGTFIFLSLFVSEAKRERKTKQKEREKTPDWTDNHYALTGISIELMFSAKPNLFVRTLNAVIHKACRLCLQQPFNPSAVRLIWLSIQSGVSSFFWYFSFSLPRKQRKRKVQQD